MLQPGPWYHAAVRDPTAGHAARQHHDRHRGRTRQPDPADLDKRRQIEARLALGPDAAQAIGDIRRDALRSGLIPIVNSMMTAGIVSLPG